jgi:hypothetical protein
MRFAADSSVLLRLYLDEEEAQIIAGFLRQPLELTMEPGCVTLLP